MSKRNLSPEQLRRRDERKQQFAALVKRVADMPETERDQLAACMPGLVNTEGHTLSMRNTLLVALQLGTRCTIVGGFRQWIKQGRVVRKGQHGASILFPRTFGDKTAATVSDEPKSGPNGERTVFLSGTVFDVSQTEILTPNEERVS